MAQNNLQNTPKPPQTPPAACPSPSEVVALHLYGLWRAEFVGLPMEATLLFEKHPELADSVVGGITRGGVQAQVAGDVDNGVFTLEESGNGQSISATWSGVVAPGSCGKEINGTWTHAVTQQSYRFVLRKQPGWN